jgi:hypothetical protein
VQAHIDTHIALIMVRETGMATTTETQLFVSRLTTAYPKLRIVVTVLFAVYDVLSSEGQRLSGHSGVPLEYMLLAESDSYLISPILAGVQPILTAGNFGEIADRLSGAGIQHLALRCEPLLETVKLLRQQGLPLLPAPPTYYQGLRNRLTQAPELEWQDAELQCLIENQILMDWQPGLPKSVLLQIFSLPILPDSLFFFEFIERRGKQAQGFGERNFQALYEAVEADLQSR